MSQLSPPVTIKQRLANGERLNVFAISRSFHPNHIEMYALQGGFSGFWIDHEHTGFTIDMMEAAVRAGRACGLDCFVRLAPTDYASVTRCLESGAGGVMAAMISTVAQAEEFVTWAKFAPRGRRGLNNWGRDGNFSLTPVAEFCRLSNERTLVGIQIETVSAVECCEEIAAIDGVDMLFVGPADLSQAYGITGQMLHPTLLSAIDRVSKACRDQGKTFGAVAFSPEQGALLMEQGCRLISLTSDVRTFQEGIAATKQSFGKLFAES
ncbi:HpcH/HpaI aldolase family protein [Planctomicrobium piriforme]|uniref:2-dehydro-3-deoxyglucarate aldolase/4-hydroxy-2-oxoheptanedioate aldolase n=1 Tax=Planctomicrobium piriforme TaxID=1576369 RepID=A0A1I3RX23_9PLAN|nr:aldolase/citrate lyase family protein [Planctomicrobium piriforme]SFJ50580.1 2-dehydro-3-deoxyglucarate aldolase/4-hydroxy-2-oxoheptanedioate aldolase [Planctomicrobium piriforme]